MILQTDNYNNFIKSTRSLREFYKIKQQDIANKLGIYIMTYSNKELGKSSFTFNEFLSLLNIFKDGQNNINNANIIALDSEIYIKALERIKTARKHHKITLEGMGSILGLSKTGYGNKESGRESFKLTEIFKILEVLDLSVDSFYDNVNSKTEYDKLLDIIKEKREEANLNQDQASAALNIKQTAYSKKESGLTEISLREFLTLCKEIKVNPEDVFKKL